MVPQACLSSVSVINSSALLIAALTFLLLHSSGHQLRIAVWACVLGLAVVCSLLTSSKFTIPYSAAANLFACKGLFMLG